MTKPGPEGSFWHGVLVGVAVSLLIWAIIAGIVLLGVRLAETV